MTYCRYVYSNKSNTNTVSIGKGKRKQVDGIRLDEISLSVEPYESYKEKEDRKIETLLDFMMQKKEKDGEAKILFKAKFANVQHVFVFPGKVRACQFIFPSAKRKSIVFVVH